MNKKITCRMPLLLLGAVLAGCASTGWHTTVNQHIEGSLGAAAHPARPPLAISAALLPRMDVPLAGAAPMLVTPRFNLVVNDAPIRNVLLGLVAGTDYSVVVSPDLSGRVTLDLEQVTVPQAMRTIRTATGADYERDGKRYYFSGPGIQTRIYRVHYLNVVRTGTSNTQMVSGELTNLGTTSAGGATATPAAGANAAPPNMRVETKTESDFWKRLKETVSALVGKTPGTAVVTDPGAGLLVVRAPASQQAVIAHLIRLMQASVDREVVLEARILEVQLSSGFQSGINWADLARLDGASLTSAQIGGGSLLGGASATSYTPALSPGQLATPLISPPAYSPVPPISAFGGMLTLALNARNFSTFIELLQTEGHVQVLSNPRVATVNNQKAVIKVGGDDFFVTGVSNTTTAVGTNAVPTTSVQLTPFFSGIALDVTPAIDGHGNVILAIHPSVSQVVQKNQTFSVSGQTFSLPLASSTIQESDDIVRAKSGQIIVIGGLMKEGTTTDHAEVPILGDIPLLGNLFRDRQVTRIKSELVILLKPVVVSGDSVWTHEAGDSEQRIREIESGN